MYVHHPPATDSEGLNGSDKDRLQTHTRTHIARSSRHLLAADEPANVAAAAHMGCESACVCFAKAAAAVRECSKSTRVCVRTHKLSAKEDEDNAKDAGEPVLRVIRS